MLRPVILVCSLLVLCVQVLPGTAIAPTVQPIGDSQQVGIAPNSYTISFSVSPSVSPERISWFFQTQQETEDIIDTNDPFLTFSVDKLNLTIDPVFASRQGVYILNATNTDGMTGTGSVTLDVQSVPAFQIFPGDRKIHERENVTFPCFPTGEPTPSVTWKFKDVTIDPVNSNKYFIGLFGDQNYGSLTIYNLEFADNGEYTCVISNEHGSNDDSATLEIQVFPVILTQPVSSNITAGGVDEITCEARGFPSPNIYWQKNGQNLTSIEQSIASFEEDINPNQQELSAIGRLTITDSVLSTGGNYSCVATNFLVTFETIFSNEVEVFVQYPPSTSAKPIEVVNQTNPADSNCSSFGIPPPTLNWYSSKDPNTPITTFGDITVETYSFINESNLQIQVSELFINNSMRNIHEANYTCAAVNGIDNFIGTPENATTELLVQVPPSIRFPSGSPVLGIVYNDIILTFVIDNASPSVKPSNVIWKFCSDSSLQTMTLSTGSRYSFSDDRLSLTISDLTHDDQGQYIITATNEAGTDQYFIRLDIEAAPEIITPPDDTNVLQSHNASLLCAATSEPMHTTQWFKGDSIVNGTSDKYTIIEMPGLMERETVSILTVYDAVMNDTDDYTCVVTNVHGSQNHTAHLEVQVTPIITTPPFDTIGIFSETSNLTCQAFGSPVPNITWIKDGIQLDPINDLDLSTDTYVNEFTRTSILFFNNLDFDDSGSYVCRAVNNLVSPVMTDSESATFTVNHPPVLRDSEGLAVVNETQTINMNCTFFSLPSPNITWSRSGFFLIPSMQIMDNEKYTIYTTNIPSDGGVLSLSTLEIMNVDGLDTGSYTCLASNFAHGPSAPVDTSSNTFSVLVQTSPVVQRISEAIPIGVKTRDITLEFQISGDVPAVPLEGIRWYLQRDNISEIIGDPRRVFSHDRKSLSLFDLELDDEGNYTMNATNIIGTGSDMIYLDVEISPVITNNSGVVDQVMGQDAIFQCTAVSEPVHITNWTFNGTPLSNNSDKYLIQGTDTIQSILTVYNVSLIDEGMYTCIADNVHGNDSATAQLRVQVPPVITQEPQEAVLLVTTTAYFNCCATGVPSPSISWLKDDVPLLSDARVTMFQVGLCGTLHISNITLTDTADYTCVASNTLAEPLSVNSSDVSLTVNYPPEVYPFTQRQYTKNESDRFILECESFGVPLPTLYWIPSSLMTLLNDSEQLLFPNQLPEFFSNIQGFNNSRFFDLSNQCLSMEPNSENNSDVCSNNSSQYTDCSVSGSLCPVPCALDISNRIGMDEMNRYIIISRLTICSLEKIDELSYTCYAVNNISNVINTAEATYANLIIQVAPDVVAENNITTAFRDRNTTLSFVINRASPDVPPEDITWLFVRQFENDSVILNSNDSHYIFSSDRRSLSIINLSTDDTGLYTLLAVNPAGVHSDSIYLDVQALPDIELFSDPVNVSSGSTIRLDCFADGSPIQDVQWLFTNISGSKVFEIRYIINNTMTRTGNIEYESFVNDVPESFITEQYSIDPPDAGRPTELYGGLTIKNITPYQAGMYSCNLSNIFGMESRTVDVRVQLIPDIVQAPNNTVCTEGGDCALSCIAIGVPSPSIIYFHNGIQVEINDGIDFETSSSYDQTQVLLNFKNIQLSDAGEYHCQADNTLGSVSNGTDVSNNATLTVTSPASVKTSLSSTIANETFDATFICAMTGIPVPEITWTRFEPQETNPEGINNDGVKFSISNAVSEGEFDLQILTSTLTISNVDKSDELMYQCSGDNSVENLIDAISTSTAPLTVQVPPTVTANKASITETKGRETTVVSFNITRDSPQVKVEDIRWSFKHIGSVGKMLLNTTCTIVNCSDTRYMRYNFSDDLTTLTISNLQVEDYGNYTLTAGNAAGENSATVNLTVNVPPQLLDSNTEVINRNESDSVLLECTADANPKPSFLWFHNGALFSGATSEEHKAFREDILTIPGNLGVTTRVSITDLKERDEGVYLCLAGNGIEPFSDREFRVDVRVVVINHCQPDPCENGGICINGIDDFTCDCQEVNDVAYDGRTCDTEVIVQIPARITRQPEDTFVNLDSRVELYCEADGSPEPTIRWSYENMLIEGVFGSPFVIENVNRRNRGYYTCIATNVVNTVTSRQALVNIPDIAEYLARLIIPISQFQGRNFTSEADQIVENINVRVAGSVVQGGDSEFYVIERRGKPINNTHNVTVPIIVTIQIGEEGVASEALRQRVEEDVRAFGFELQISDEGGVIRFNTCPPETTDLPSPDGDPSLDLQINWVDTQIGIVAKVPCPCNFSLGSTALFATRECGGDFVTRAVWLEPDTAACEFSVTARMLCRLADLTPAERVNSLAELTRDSINLGPTEVTIGASVIESTEEISMGNNTRINTSLTTLDNVLRANRSSLLESQRASRSQGRFMNVFETLTASYLVTSEMNETIIRDTFLTFISGNSSVANLTLNSSNLALRNPSNLALRNPSNLALRNPETNIDEPPCIPEASIEVLRSRGRNDGYSFSTFANDGLFIPRRSESTNIATAVLDFTINSDSSLDSLDSIDSIDIPINITFSRSSSANQLNQGRATCVFWNENLDGGFGDWDTDGCRLTSSDDPSSSEFRCQCDHLTSFSILLDVSAEETPPPDEALAFEVFTFIGISVSVVCLIITLVTYLGSPKLRKSEASQLLINLCFALMGLYLTFVFAAQGQKISTFFCALIGALLHYFLLVVFFIMAAEAVDLFIKLVIVLGSRIQHYIKKASIIAWILPVFIVPFAISPHYLNYVHAHYCGATGPALYVGVLVPFLVVYIFNWTIFCIIMISLIKKSSNKRFSEAKKKNRTAETKQQCRVAFTVSVLFGLGWGFGLLASQAIDVQGVRVVFNTLFTIFTTFQGFFIFVLYVLLSPNARKEWKRWILRKEDKGREATSSGVGSSSRQTKSTSVKYSAANKRRTGTLYHNVYSSQTSSKASFPSVTDDYSSSVYEAHQPVLDELKQELNLKDINNSAFLLNPLDDYGDVLSLTSECDDTKSLGETTFAFPNPNPPSLRSSQDDELHTGEDEGTVDECTTLDNPFLTMKGERHLTMDGEQLQLLSQRTDDSEEGKSKNENVVIPIDMSESMTQSQGYYGEESFLIKTSEITKL